MGARRSPTGPRRHRYRTRIRTVAERFGFRLWLPWKRARTVSRVALRNRDGSENATLERNVQARERRTWRVEIVSPRALTVT